MLLTAFPQLSGKAFFARAEKFFHSRAYIVLVAALMVLSETLGGEPMIFYLYFALGAGALLLTEDTAGILPIACCSYMTISPRNNPVRHTGTVFTQPAFMIQLAVLLSVSVALILIKVIMLGIAGKLNVGFPRLLPGLVLLGAAYMLGGLTDSYEARSAFFGFVQFCVLAFFYTLFLTTDCFSKLPKDVLFFLFSAIGAGLLVEVAGMYVHGFLIAGAKFCRYYLFTGWGVYNNVACVLAMCIPAPCYFACVRRRSYLYVLLSTLFYLGVVFTQSRSGIFFGAVVYAGSVIYVLFSCEKRERKNVWILGALLAAGLVVFAAVFRVQLLALFRSLLAEGTDFNYRDTIYRRCWEAFLRSPVFGVGFYRTPGFSFEGLCSFMPPRAHDTYLQLLASCGIFGMIAYLIHRADTVVLFLRRPSLGRNAAALMVLALLLTSTLDCHFFNIGPVILYSTILAFVEAQRRKNRTELFVRI